jgi:AcrR family transcriptional regulator
MNRREASKKETRRLILKAARTLFARKGMEECTMRDIAEKAGVSPASVVVHFKSKTALLEEALCGDIETAFTEIVASMPEDLSFRDRLMRLSTGFLALYDRNRDLLMMPLRYCSVMEARISETKSTVISGVLNNMISAPIYKKKIEAAAVLQSTSGKTVPSVFCSSIM